MNNSIWINSSAFQTTDRSEMFGIARSLGLQGVELVVSKQVTHEIPKHYSFLDVEKFEQAEANDIISKCNAEQIRISLSAYNNIIGGSEETQSRARDILVKLIRAAAMLGGNTNDIKVGTFVGFDHSHPGNALEYNLEKFQEVFAPIIKYAEEQNVTILYENCPMEGWTLAENIFTYNNLPATLAARKLIYSLIPSQAHGETYDPSHDVWQFNDPVEVVRHSDISRIHRIHVKSTRLPANDKRVLWGSVFPSFDIPAKYKEVIYENYPTGRWKRYPYEAALPGVEGESLPDWSLLIDELLKKKFDGPFIIEYGLSFNEEGKRNVIRKCSEYLKQKLAPVPEFSYKAINVNIPHITYKQLK